MKIIYILLIFSFWQTILNETDISIEVKSVAPIICQKTSENEIYYGFSFTAVTSGFKKENSFQFYLKTPNYAFAECFVPASPEEEEEEEEQQIICQINAGQFPLYELTLELPDEINNDKSIPIYGMENVDKVIIYDSFCSPDYVYKLTPDFPDPAFCSEGKNYLVGYTEREFLPGNLRNLKTDADYFYKPYVFIDDGDFQRAECLVYETPEENSDLYKISCKIPSGSKAQFFPGVYEELSQEEHDSTRFDINEVFPLQKCGSCYLTSTFSKFAGLLILSLILL